MFKNLCPGAVGLRGSTQELLRLAAELGFDGMDLDPHLAREMAESEASDRYEAVFRRHHVVPGAWGLPVEFRRDEGTFECDLEQLGAYAAAAAVLGCRRVYTWLLPFSDELPYREHFALMSDRGQRMAAVLAEHGCRLGLEFVGTSTLRAGHRYEFIHRMEQMLELCAAIGTGNVGLLLDSWHWYASGGKLESLRSLRNEDVVYVHVNDAPPGVPVDEQIDGVRRLPGETGVIDIGGFLGALQQIGYDGPVSAEPFDVTLSRMSAEEIARRVAASLDKVWKVAGI